MKITENQLQILLQILYCTLQLNDRGTMPLDRENRCKLYEQIMNQQSNDIKEVE